MELKIHTHYHLDTPTAPLNAQIDHVDTQTVPTHAKTHPNMLGPIFPDMLILQGKSDHRTKMGPKSIENYYN